MDTFGLGSPNCFVVNLSSLVRRLKRSFCQRANRVVAVNSSHLDRICLGRSCMTFITYDESMEGRALPEAIENALRALFCEKMYLTWESMREVWGDFHFAPNHPQGAGPFEARLLTDFCLTVT